MSCSGASHTKNNSIARIYLVYSPTASGTIRAESVGFYERL